MRRIEVNQVFFMGCRLLKERRRRRCQSRRGRDTEAQISWAVGGIANRLARRGVEGPRQSRAVVKKKKRPRFATGPAKRDPAHTQYSLCYCNSASTKLWRWRPFFLNQVRYSQGTMGKRMELHGTSRLFLSFSLHFHLLKRPSSAILSATLAASSTACRSLQWPSAHASPTRRRRLWADSALTQRRD